MGLAGVTDYSTQPSYSVKTTCGDMEVLGGYGELANSSLFKSYDLGTDKDAMVDMDIQFLKIDTWDDEV